MSAVEKLEGVQVWLMEPQDVARYASQMEPSMKKALGRGFDWSTSEILTRALRCDILVWGAYDSGKFIGHVTAMPRGNQLIVLTLGGERALEWIHLVCDQLKFLLDEGTFDSVVTSARPGMAKWLKSFGWKPYRVLMEFKGA